MKTPIKTLVCAIAVAGFSGSAVAADYTMRIAHQLPSSHHVAQAIEWFGEEVEKNTNGKVDVEIFGGAQLYGPSQFHAAVARGQIEAASIINLIWGGTIPEMQVFNIPYLLTDPTTLKEFPDSDAAQLLNDKMEAKGVKNIAWLLDANNAVFTSNDAPLTSPEDFEGLKIRGLSRIFDTGLIAMDAAPSTMPGSEVYQGMQTGVIDAAITSAGAAHSRRYYEVQDYGAASDLIAVYQNLAVNPAWWNNLPKDIQTIIQDAAQQASVSLLPESSEVDPQGIAQLREDGMEVTVLSEGQVAKLRDAMQSAITEAFIESSPDGEKLIELIKQL